MNEKDYSEIIKEIQSIIADGKDFSKIKNRYITGGCYIYAKTICCIIKEAKIVINREIEHCAILLNDKMFDAQGIIPKHLRSGFRLLKKDEDNFCLNEYGFNGINGKKKNNISLIITYLQKYSEKHNQNLFIKENINLLMNLY